MRFSSPGESGLQWLFLDLNSYFASVEQQDNPHLRGKPVAVVPMQTDATCAIAASYEAKAYGIKTGTKIYEAKRLCPSLICVLARHDRYVHYHHKVVDEVIKHIPINKIWSVDELSCRLPPRLRTREAVSAKVAALKDGLRHNVGPAIRCSVGVAPNSFLAKVATDLQKPDGFVILSPADLPGPLLDLKLTDLPGINVNMERRLHRAGVTSVEKLWNLSPKHARKVWGSVGGERFWYNLRGFDVPDIPTNPSVIGHSRMLDPALRFPDPARLVARRLTVKAATRMRRQDFFAGCFVLAVRTVEGQRWAAESRLSEPAQDNHSFLHALDDLWDAMMGDLRPHKLIKVSMTLTGLRRKEDITPDLFAKSTQAQCDTSRRQTAIAEAMDRINTRFGAEALQLGVSPKTKAGYVGTKISFSRIPDAAEFSE